MRMSEDQQGSTRLNITLDMTQPATNTQNSSMIHPMDIKRMLNPSEDDSDSSSGSGSEDEEEEEENEQDHGEDDHESDGPRVDPMDFSMMLHPASNNTDSGPEDDDKRSYDVLMAPKHIYLIARVKPMSMDSPTGWNLDDRKLPPLKMEMSQQPTDSGYYGSEQAWERQLLPVPPQVSHLGSFPPDSRKSRRSPTRDEPRGTQKPHRELSIRNILPQIHPNGRTDSQELHFDVRTSPNRRCSCPDEELKTTSAERSQRFKSPKRHKPAHSNKACKSLLPVPSPLQSSSG
jgi:hypothetical protein